MRCSAILVTAMLAAAAAGCQTAPSGAPEKARPSVVVGEPEKWREVASPAGEDAIEGLETTWAQALEEARQRFRRRVTAEGALLEAGGGLPRAAPAPGPYRCRVVRIGAGRSGAPAYAAGRQGFCFVGVQDDQLSLTSEVSGARIGGHLWETEQSARLVFLGAAIPGGARLAPAYGANAEGDVAGIVERLGQFRYRLAIATPGAAQKLAIFELTAAPRD
jgi:hypothetical protein